MASCCDIGGPSIDEIDAHAIFLLTCCMCWCHPHPFPVQVKDLEVSGGTAVSQKYDSDTSDDDGSSSQQGSSGRSVAIGDMSPKSERECA